MPFLFLRSLRTFRTCPLRQGAQRLAGVATTAATAAALAAALALPLATHAADDKKNDREARRAQLLQQRLEQEEAAWQTERSDLQKKLADAEASSTTLKTQTDKLTGDLASASHERSSLKARVTDLTKQLANANDAAQKQAALAQAELERFMKAREEERTAQNTRFDAQSAVLATCTDKNTRLLKIGHELLLKYRDKGVVDALRQDDPVLGLKDVDIFNQVQDYRDKLDAEHLAPAAKDKP